MPYPWTSPVREQQEIDVLIGLDERVHDEVRVVGRHVVGYGAAIFMPSWMLCAIVFGYQR